MHALPRRQEWDIGRDQTARLMRLAGVRGVLKARSTFTTKPDPEQDKPKDLVQRCLWVADIEHVATWSGSPYMAFVTDVFSRQIVGWNVTSTLQALSMAAFTTDGPLDELVHHADHGSNYLSIVHTDRITELGANPSTRTIGNSHDNALAQAMNSLHKTELTRRRGP